MELKILLMAAWYDYYNNYLSHQKFSDAHGLSPAYAKQLTDKGNTFWKRGTMEEREQAIKLSKRLK